MCLEDEANHSNGVLARAEIAHIARLKRKLADEEAHFAIEAVEGAEEAGHAFEGYRTSACEAAAKTAAGGNGANDLRLMCQAALNLSRAHWLDIQQRELPYAD